MKHPRLAAILLLAGAVSVPGIAQQVASASPAAVKAGTYKVEPYHTQVLFSLSHFGFTDFEGFFSGASGTLQLDPAHPAATKLTVTVPTSAVTTTVGKLDDELKGEQWFDAARFPTATFTSTKVTPTGPGRASVTGDLTLHGVTHPVTLQARLMGSGVNPLDKSETVGFEATGTIKRTDYGVKQYAPLVGDTVTLTINAAFVRQG